MTVANDLLTLALKNGNINGVGQTPLPEDINDSFKILNAWINEINMERRVKVNPTVLPTFPSLTLDVPFWTPYEHVLLTTMAVRLRQIYSLPAVELDVKLAVAAMQAFNAINQHQIAPLHPGVPNTVLQAIFLALRMAGRITDEQSVSDGSKDVNDAFALMVMMLGQWQRKRWLIWNEIETARVATGANWYSIGPGMDFDVPRPDKIHAARVTIGAHGSFGVLPEELPFPLGASARTPGLVNFPLEIIESHEDWNRIAVFDLQSVPSAVFYDSAYPVGHVYFWPVPPADSYQLHLVVKASLPIYASVSEPLDVPPEYLDAIVNNLACRILVASGQPISPFLLGQARASLETIKMANSQIPQLSIPPFLSGHRGGSNSTGAGLNQAWTIGGPSVLQ